MQALHFCIGELKCRNVRKVVVMNCVCSDNVPIRLNAAATSHALYYGHLSPPSPGKPVGKTTEFNFYGQEWGKDKTYTHLNASVNHHHGFLAKPGCSHRGSMSSFCNSNVRPNPLMGVHSNSSTFVQAYGGGCPKLSLVRPTLIEHPPPPPDMDPDLPLSKPQETMFNAISHRVSIPSGLIQKKAA